MRKIIEKEIKDWRKNEIINNNWEINKIDNHEEIKWKRVKWKEKLK